MVTLDSHQRCHIAHALFWVDKDGKHPDPFTVISVEDVETCKWMPRQAEHKEHALLYVKKLEKAARYALCIWPYHCIIGTPGNNIVPVLNEALALWADQTGRSVDYLLKVRLVSKKTNITVFIFLATSSRVALCRLDDATQ